ncbi:MAG: hypothetical protein AAGI23_22330 [Bacteroidota bacterium]
MKTVQKLLLLFAVAGTVFACNKDTVLETVEDDFLDDSIYEIESRGEMGRFGCFDWVFPISIRFADDSVVEVEDYEAWRTAMQEWREANPEAEGRPQLKFPVEVTSEEGEVMSLADREALKELLKECRREYCEDNQRECRRRYARRTGRCFEFVFPIDIAFADSTITVETPRQLKRVLRARRGEERIRPRFVFPLDVKLKADESIVIVEDAEALKALRQECRDAEDGE